MASFADTLVGQPKNARNSRLRIGVVAGEASGDILGAGLIAELRHTYPDLSVEGVGGPRMVAQGMTSFYPLDRLSVMGLVDPLKRLPELLRMRRNLVAHFKAEPPSVFIGIDSPDFNLGIEQRLRGAGITTAHYVSPSVWAWRQGRVKKIARAVDLMLTLFPFEAAFYRDNQVPVHFVGHPLADEYPLQPDVDAARKLFNQQPQQGALIAVLPGSRGGEVAMLGPVFIQAMLELRKRQPNCHFLLPAANIERYKQLQDLLAAQPALIDCVTLLNGQSRAAMTAADVVVMASGTTTLEAMLLKKPMVVAYKVSPLSYQILSRLVKSEFIALPNLLAQQELVPELLQDQVSPQSVAAQVDSWLQDPGRCDALQQRFTEIHLQLRQGASRCAAEAIAQLVRERQ